MLTTSVERLAGTAAKLTVTVSAEEVDRAIASAYARVGEKVRVPGFRKGKAPRQIVDNYVGRDYVLAEATEELVNETYPRALDAEDLRTIEAPEMDELDTVQSATEFTYVAEIELRPELTLAGGGTGITVTVPAREASDAEIDLQIDSLRDRFATLEPVEDRGVAADDFVLLSFTGYVDGETYDGNEVDKYLYEMGRGLMPVEFDNGIIGLEAGAETRVEFAIPDTSSNPEFVGKTAAFDVTVHEVKAKKLPELDDEFATNVGGFDTVADLRADLKTRLDVQKTLQHDRLKERAAREELAKRLEGDVPEAMVKSRTGTMMRDFATQLDTRGMTFEAYLEATGVTPEVVESDIAAQAAEFVREDLALEALFRELGLEVSEEDIETELADVADATGTTADEARARWVEMGLMSIVREQVVHRKAVEWLMENVAVVDEVIGEAAEKPADKPAKKKAAPRAKKAAAEDAAPAAESTEE